MKIAQIAPLYESVPPKQYGGTERVVSYLTEELVRKGHEVTLFASGDSVTSAKLVPCATRSLRQDEANCHPLIQTHLMLEKVCQMADSFDIVHFHVDFLHFGLSRRAGYSNVTTLHGRLDIPWYDEMFREYSEMPLISISDSQRKPIPHANWAATVHHGLPPTLYRPGYETGKYLTFIGRISPEKRVDRAIEIAIRANIPLKIAAKIDSADKLYFEKEIKSLLNHPLITFLGEVNEPQKQELLEGALALLFPIDWEEPFGLVMIESMACGTPVIAWKRGSVPEVIRQGTSGILVSSIEAAVQAVEAAKLMSRELVRKDFESYFLAERMAEDYCAVYNRILQSKDTRSLRAAI